MPAAKAKSSTNRDLRACRFAARGLPSLLVTLWALERPGRVPRAPGLRRDGARENEGRQKAAYQGGGVAKGVRGRPGSGRVRPARKSLFFVGYFRPGACRASDPLANIGLTVRWPGVAWSVPAGSWGIAIHQGSHSMFEPIAVPLGALVVAALLTSTEAPSTRTRASAAQVKPRPIARATNQTARAPTVDSTRCAAIRPTRPARRAMKKAPACGRG